MCRFHEADVYHATVQGGQLADFNSPPQESEEGIHHGVPGADTVERITSQEPGYQGRPGPAGRH